MYILQSLILCALAVVSMAVDMCPESWSVIMSTSGRDITEESNKQVNDFRAKESLMVGVPLQNLSFNDELAKQAHAFIQSCDFNFIIGNKDNLLSNFKTTKFDGRNAYYLQVSEEENCDADWKSVANSWFNAVKGIKFGANDRCLHMQMNSAGCSFACIRIGRRGGKGRSKSEDVGQNGRNMYMRMYNCNYGLVCHNPSYMEHYTKDCKDFCYQQ